MFDTPYPLLCFPFIKSKPVPYSSSYSCHHQNKFVYAPVLSVMQKGIVIFLYTEILLQICCDCRVLRWGYTLLYNSKKLQENNQHISLQMDKQTLKKLHWSTCMTGPTDSKRFRILLGTASIASVVNSNLPVSKDCEMKSEHCRIPYEDGWKN